MSCFNPMQAIRSVNSLMRTKKGAFPVNFISKVDSFKYKDNPNLISGIPCGQCIGCRLARSAFWAVRMVNESQLHSQNSFITLTFNQDSLLKRDSPMSLDKREFQLFMKRLRKSCWSLHLKRMRILHFFSQVFFCKKAFMWFAKKTFKSPRYYMCGEYGERFQRPHYHAILFGFDFDDKKLEIIKNGKQYFTSALLSSLWKFGSHIITDVNYDTCAYVARYIMKKHLGKNAWRQYHQYIDEQTGELVGHRIPEYTTMSRRSGIGKEWLDKYLIDVYPRDKIFMRGKGFLKPPKYYDTLYEVIDPSDFLRIKQARIDAALDRASDNTPDRLHAKQVVKLAEIKLLSRSLE